MSKLRARETLGFRPETPAQEKLIQDALEATGFTMARLLREAVMAGLPLVVSGVQSQQKAAFAQFQSSLRETTVAQSTQPTGEQPAYKITKRAHNPR